jgi:hypothetical protein
MEFMGPAFAGTTRIEIGVPILPHNFLQRKKLIRPQLGPDRGI